MKLKSYYPAEIDVDGETMKIRVKRLNFSEGSELRAKIREAQSAKAKDEGDGVFGEDLVSEIIRSYVTVAGKLSIEEEDDDGNVVNTVRVKTGAELLDAFGGRNEILLAMYAAVMRQNNLTEKEKNASSSPTGSAPSSGGHEKDQAGPKRATTAASAGSAGSAGNGDATSQASDPSGSTDDKTRPSSPTSARSFH